MTNNNLKYLIAGTGGVGGSIAAFLSLSGKDVTCIARGEHLAAIRKNGLQLHSDLKGEHSLINFTKAKLSGRISASMQNVFTVSKYRGDRKSVV